MCGLAGVVGLNGARVDQRVIGRMSSILRHRGPDDEGSYIGDSVGLGFRRLSILDLSPAGHQPMISPEGDTVIVFNGEIYNFVELRKELESLGHRFRSTGDTEVLLHSYLQWGRDCLRRLNGMWAFLIYDKQRRTLFGSRDRFGKKPLYRYHVGDLVLFGSEIKAILASGHYRGGVNWRLASRFFLENSFDRVETRGETFYSDILEIPPGSAFELDLRGTWKEWRYWSISDIPRSDVTNPEISFDDIFEDAVRLRLRSDVPVGIFLSGGVDSTSIACAVARLRQGSDDDGATSPLLAFSYQANEFDESTYINDTVRQTGVELVPFRPDPRQLLDTLDRVLWHQDEPLHSVVAVITFELSRLAAGRGVKVILNGGGPDEYLAGYFSFFHDYWYSLVSRGQIAQAWREVRAHRNAHGGSAFTNFGRIVASHIKAGIRRVPGGGELARRMRTREIRDTAWFTPDLISRLPDHTVMHRDPGLDAALQHAVDVAPLPYYLRMEDRNSMAHSIEARMPFLDFRLVSLAFQLPPEWKMRGPWNKYVLRAAMRGRIPESARTRLDKMGFPVPTKRWFADCLHEPMQDLLRSQQVRERGIYEVDVIQRDLQLHKEGRLDVSRQLFKVFQFEVWSKLEENHRRATMARADDSPELPFAVRR